MESQKISTSFWDLICYSCCHRIALLSSTLSWSCCLVKLFKPINSSSILWLWNSIWWKEDITNCFWQRLALIDIFDLKTIINQESCNFRVILQLSATISSSIFCWTLWEMKSVPVWNELMKKSQSQKLLSVWIWHPKMMLRSLV